LKEQILEHPERVGDMAANSDMRTPGPQEALSCAKSIIATLRELFVVLAKRPRVHTVNATFYRDFRVSKKVTHCRFVYAMGTGQPLDSVFRAVNEERCQPVESATVRALRDGVGRWLTNRTLRCSG